MRKTIYIPEVKKHLMVKLKKEKVVDFSLFRKLQSEKETQYLSRAR